MTTHAQDVEYSEFRRQIVEWIKAGAGAVTPSMVGAHLRDHREHYPGNIYPREIEILESSPDWFEADYAIKRTFPRRF